MIPLKMNVFCIHVTPLNMEVLKSNFGSEVVYIYILHTYKNEYTCGKPKHDGSMIDYIYGSEPLKI